MWSLKNRDMNKANHLENKLSLFWFIENRISKPNAKLKPHSFQMQPLLHSLCHQLYDFRMSQVFLPLAILNCKRFYFQTVQGGLNLHQRKILSNFKKRIEGWVPKTFAFFLVTFLSTNSMSFCGSALSCKPFRRSSLFTIS